MSCYEKLMLINLIVQHPSLSQQLLEQVSMVSSVISFLGFHWSVKGVTAA